jgi:hypothetical protein
VRVAQRVSLNFLDLLGSNALVLLLQQRLGLGLVVCKKGMPTCERAPYRRGKETQGEQTVGAVVLIRMAVLKEKGP